MELGLLGGVGRTATMLYDKLNFDLLITSSEYLDLSRPGEFPRARLAQARTAKGVDDVLPLSFGVGGWRLPAQSRTVRHARPAARIMSINVIGVPPGQLDRAFRVGPDGSVSVRRRGPRTGARSRPARLVPLRPRSKPEFGDVRDLIAIAPNGAERRSHPTERPAGSDRRRTSNSAPGSVGTGC